MARAARGGAGDRVEHGAARDGGAPREPARRRRRARALRRAAAAPRDALGRLLPAVGAHRAAPAPWQPGARLHARRRHRGLDLVVLVRGGRGAARLALHPVRRAARQPAALRARPGAAAHAQACAGRDLHRRRRPRGRVLARRRQDGARLRVWRAARPARAPLPDGRRGAVHGGRLGRDPGADGLPAQAARLPDRDRRGRGGAQRVRRRGRRGGAAVAAHRRAAARGLRRE
mmetsp:Transcript_8983/g.22278  ORF Transcript_8983/g.22278 Transcript_8983/m.22278 type:complete len:231 (+) Transcript_8983:1490-2182(+)